MKIDLIRMLPFLETEELDELVAQILSKEVPSDKISISSLLPFLNDNQINQLFDAALQGEITERPAIFLPFVSDGKLDEVAMKIESGEITTMKIETLLPFLEEESIKAMFKRGLEDLKKQDN